MKLLAVAVLGMVAIAMPSAVSAADVAFTPICNNVPNSCSTGWYRTPVTVSFAVNGVLTPSCTTIISTDPGGTATCSVTLIDGSTRTASVPIKLDQQPPSVDSISAARSPDANGWYNHAVGVTATGSDATSGIASCTSVTYAGPDSGSATVTGTCTDKAGNVSAAKTLTLQYDATAPSVSAAPARAADSNDWYNHAVSVAFQGSDAVSGIDSCTSGTYSGPDSAGASVSGSCRDKAGNVGNASFGLKYDATPPSVTGATADRPPDANGWYNHALTVAFAGTDATSGVASCDSVPYSKPDSASASVSGRCRDNAGNDSAAAPFAFKFDSTPPKLAKLTVTPSDSAVKLAWSASPDVASLTIRRTGSKGLVTLYGGKRITAFVDKKARKGKRYSYVLTALDAAGNAAVEKTTGAASAPLLSPRAGAHVRAGAVLRWRAVKRAAYYNVQLWAHGKKVLTTWPTGTSLALPRLRRGTYTWLVWPGFGARSAHRYGAVLGKSSFVVKG